MKPVSVVQSFKLVETSSRPLIPRETSRLSCRPLLVMGGAEPKPRCRLNVLLDTMLTMLVVEAFPLRSTAYALITFVPAVSGNTAAQLVQALVLVARPHAPPFN